MLDNFCAAIRCHMRNDFQSATKLYNQCIESGFRAAEALHYFGILLVQCGFEDQGSTLIRQSRAHALMHNKVDHNEQLLIDPQIARNRIERELISSALLPYPLRQTGTVDDWRHCRMLDFIAALASTAPESHWLTIGDQYGHDAQRIAENGVKNVTPSGLSTEYLAQAKAFGAISNFLMIDAERIDLPDRSFDFVSCKEALHHMPRPFLAIYEMLRVARIAVCLVAEPTDPLIDWQPEGKPVKLTREFYTDIRAGDAIRYLSESGETLSTRLTDWWEDGPLNYVYTISEREMGKLMRGYGLFAMATKSLNDFYNRDWASAKAQVGSEGFDKTVEQITLYDRLCELTGSPKSRLTCILFKQPPSPATREALGATGFKITMTRTRLLPIEWPDDVRDIS
jgi:hypothetical protein